MAAGDAVPLAARFAVCFAGVFFLASFRSGLASVTLSGLGSPVATGDPPGMVTLLDVESAEAWDLACFGATGKLACWCAAGACRFAVDVTGDAFAAAADDAPVSATAGDGLAGGADAATGGAVATSAAVALAGATGPVAGARESSLVEAWLTAGAPVDGSGRAGPALSDGAVDDGGPALLVSAVSGLAVLRSAFSILPGAVSAILGPSDFGASASLICGAGGSGPISAAGFFDPTAGEEVACGSTAAGAAAGAPAALDCPAFCSVVACFAAGGWT
ncbi:MAG: hypothetical protein ACREDC_08375 [Bradyrhizobium sp.]